MSSTLTPLILDFLEWVDLRPRSYAETMDAWRTSCPRLTVWEDAIDAGFVTREHARLALTLAGRRFLAESGRLCRTPAIS